MRKEKEKRREKRERKEKNLFIALPLYFLSFLMSSFSLESENFSIHSILGIFYINSNMWITL